MFALFDQQHQRETCRCCRQWQCFAIGQRRCGGRIINYQMVDAALEQRLQGLLAGQAKPFGNQRQRGVAMQLAGLDAVVTGANKIVAVLLCLHGYRHRHGIGKQPDTGLPARLKAVGHRHGQGKVLAAGQFMQHQRLGAEQQRKQAALARGGSGFQAGAIGSERHRAQAGAAAAGRRRAPAGQRQWLDSGQLLLPELQCCFERAIVYLFFQLAGVGKIIGRAVGQCVAVQQCLQIGQQQPVGPAIAGQVMDVQQQQRLAISQCQQVDGQQRAAGKIHALFQQALAFCGQRGFVCAAERAGLWRDGQRPIRLALLPDAAVFFHQPRAKNRVALQQLCQHPVQLLDIRQLRQQQCQRHVIGGIVLRLAGKPDAQLLRCQWQQCIAWRHINAAI